MQPWGLGDVIFSMSAVRSLNDDIIWPVMPYYVKQLSDAYPDMTFIDWRLLNIDYNRKDRYELHGYDVIPLRWQDSPLVDCMKKKYAYFNLDWHDWKYDVEWLRDYNKEEFLFQLLHLVEGERYNLISTKFGNDSINNKPSPHSMIFKEPDNGLINIHMTMIEGFSLFDWAKVIERAERIDFVSSSLLYLVELLELEAKEIHIYPRLPFEKNLACVDYIFSKNYTIH